MISPQTARTNIALSIVAKMVSVVVAIFSVPLLLALLGTKQYGVWVTLTSLVAFISLLDIGVGNSLRNSVASMDNMNGDAIRSEFIGFFRLLCCLGVVAAICAILIFPKLDVAAGYSFAAQVLYLPIVLVLPLMLGSSILQGARATGLQAVIQASGNWGFFAIVGVFVHIKYTPSLEILAFSWSLLYVITLIVTFFFALKKVQLTINLLCKRFLTALKKDRLYIGLEFLVLQMSSLTLYNLGNLIIYNQLGANEVARYDVTNKVFQIGLSIFAIIIGVMWPEIAKARAEKNQKLLKYIYKKLVIIAGIFCVLVFIGAFFVPAMVNFWTQQRIQIEMHEAFAIASVVIIQSLAYVGAVFMNAFEKIRIQIIISVGSIASMMPLAYYLIHEGMGIVAIPFASILLTLPAVFACNIGAIKLIRNIK